MLWAVHLADGTVRPEWCALGWLAAAGLVAAFARRVPDDKVARVGLVTAALFVASQLHIRVGPASVHLLLNGLAGVLLGRAAVAAIVVALTLQLLLFGHGGLTTLGLNVVVYAAPAVVAGWFVARSASEDGLSSSLALRATNQDAVIGGLTAAGSVALNAGCLLLGGTAEVDARAVGLLALCHLPVIAAEAAVTGFAVAAIRQAGNTSGNGVSH